MSINLGSLSYIISLSLKLIKIINSSTYVSEDLSLTKILIKFIISIRIDSLLNTKVIAILSYYEEISKYYSHY